MEYSPKCPPLLPYFSCKLLCTCQVTTAEIANKHIHCSRLCLEGLEIGIKLIVLYARQTLWLPAMEVQDTP